MSNYILSILRTGSAQFSSTSQIENSINQQRMKGSQEKKTWAARLLVPDASGGEGGEEVLVDLFRLRDRVSAGRAGGGGQGGPRRAPPAAQGAGTAGGGAAAVAGSAAWDARLGPPPVRPWQCIIQPCFSSFRFCCGETYSKLDILLHVTPGGETGIGVGN